MERNRILYYYLEEKKCARKHRFSRIEFPLAEAELGNGDALTCCLVPEYERRKQPWEEDMLTERMNDVWTKGLWQTYYLHPRLAKMTGIREKIPPEPLLDKLFDKIPCWEYLYCIGSRNVGRGERGFWDDSDGSVDVDTLRCRLTGYLPRINHFTLIGEETEEWRAFGEYIYEEYGIPTSYMRQMERTGARSGHTVVLDGRKNYKIPYGAVPEGAFYVDLWSVEEKRIQLAKIRRDVRYVSIVKFLDTIVKNGYNTIVNQTH